LAAAALAVLPCRRVPIHHSDLLDQDGTPAPGAAWLGSGVRAAGWPEFSTAKKARWPAR